MQTNCADCGAKPSPMIRPPCHPKKSLLDWRRSTRRWRRRANVGDYGDGHVRFSLIENEERTRQALRGIKQMFAKSKEAAIETV
jgi:hypothetical protein